MRPARLLFALATGLAAASAQSPPASPWPEITRENKPWTRWWWPGSAVDRASLTAQMEKLAAAGLGGVEITPIYGARGYEDRYIEFLSPKWIEMLEHVAREGQRLGLGIDMATGTGWPFGGPWVKPDHALQRAVVRDGRLAGEPTKMMVKRAAPGGEGLVIDPYSPDALRRYLAPFEKAFASLPRGLVRGQFHDSFEYYNASWTARLPEVFRQMHGYDVHRFAAELTARNASDVTTVDRDTLARIKSDYRDTLAKLHLDYLRTWVQWSHERGFLVRNQSHGAPANLLDLYANADIAETEIFGSTLFPIPGLRREHDEVRHDQDLPESLVLRMASSAGHVAGHNLSSSESATWLRDHWKVSLAYVKPELDRIFADGINHIFYHGTVFSPPDAPWPGWLFYASTQFQPNNTWWDDFGALNRYVARVQSILQRGKPDNDILLYWPLADVWDNADGLMKMLGVHDVKWLTEQPVGKIARTLMERGYSFDYISDAQLEQTTTGGRPIATKGGAYRILVVPATRRMPVATLEHLVRLMQNGVTVVFEKFPEDVPGYGRLEQRRTRFKQLVADLRKLGSADSDVFASLQRHEIRREQIADAGVSFIRRATAVGADYFFTNLAGKRFDGWTRVAEPSSIKAKIAPRDLAIILDPLSGKSGKAAIRHNRPNGAEVYLQLAPGESLIVRLAATNPGSPHAGALAPNPFEVTAILQQLERAAADAWPYRAEAGPPVTLTGRWSITFTKGGPDLPPPLQTTELKSWTELGGDEARRFGGTARYRLEFNLADVVARLPSPASDKRGAFQIRAAPEDWRLDLGDVRESARVRLNGRDVTTAWSLPFRVRVGEYLRPERNVLEIDVTNLAANRIRDLDRRRVSWKIMREINFVNINYKPFDASNWPLTPSGLLGPVMLTPLRAPKL